MSVNPLLDFFKRGDVARDVRLLAAQGALAPRAYEQLSILVLLLEDQDPEIRQTAEYTLSRIPPDVLSAFLARSEVPLGLREFFADRGIFPADVPAEDAESPLVESEGSDALTDEEEEEDRTTVTQKLASMSFVERLKAAMKGSKEMRAVLVRDPNKMISAAVLSSPKITGQEVEGIARMASVSEDILRIIASNRAWMKSYKIVSALTRNPKAPVALTMNLIQRLSDRDVATLAVDRNVPEPLRIAARKRVVASTSRK